MKTSRPGFSLLDGSATGILFTNRLSDSRAAENQIRLNGSGVALGDIDGDGWCDVYLCGLESGNALYRNLGNWKFADVTSTAGVACEDQYSTGAAFADVDGDGDLDLLVAGIGTGVRLFINTGTGTFIRSPHSGLIPKLGATSLALADIDNDGDLDLYVANYRTTTIRSTGFAVLNVNGKRFIRPEDRDRLEYTPEGRILEHGEPDILYRNDGKGRFVPVLWNDGTFLDEHGTPLKRPPFDWGLSAMFRDLNGDGAPDLYVCNDFHSTDKIWMNDGKGRFRPIPQLAFRNTSTFSMAIDVADLDRDGLDDLFVADMLSLRHSRRLMQLAASDPYQPQPGVFEDRPQFDRNTLQLNRGDGTYAEVARYAGLEATDWTWSAAFLDVDLDGYEDLLCTTGHMFDTQDLDAEARIAARGPWRRDQISQKLLMFPRMQQPNVALRNRGNLTFEEVSASWGFDRAGVSHGMALGDLDNDGDLDVVVNQLNDLAGVYRNNAAEPRIAVRLKGLAPNTRGIGAKIRVVSGSVEQAQEMIGGGRYLSADDPMRVFAAESLTNRYRIEVRWRKGGLTVIDSVLPNQFYEIGEPAEPLAREKNAESAPPGVALFQEIGLRHAHAEEPFDDYARQPLLPWKLSQLGPGLAWSDVNHDGWDDLVIGSGRGGRMALFLNDAQGGLQPAANAALAQPITRDQSGLIGLALGPGQHVILAGSANYEDGLTNGAMVHQFDLQQGKRTEAVPGQPASCGPLAAADVDSDGDLDLFTGGRVIGGRWPEPASSLMLRNEGGRLQIDQTNAAVFANIGLVSAAVFSDLNGDAAPDLVLACELGPVRVFMNEGSRFRDATVQLGLDRFSGLWNGIASGDFDGDGRMDLAASNWGLNTAYQSAHEAGLLWSVASNRSANGDLAAAAGVNPLLIYSGDYDRNTTVDVIEARLDRDLKRTVPLRSFNELARGFPTVRERFATFAAYNQADVVDVVGPALRQQQPLRAVWLGSTLFLNRGDYFEPRLLPAEAQFAPAFGIAAGDIDGDGATDLVLSQNFFPVQPTASRLDAGRSVVLRGDGTGGFSALSAAESGIAVYGEGRGLALSDFDGDARMDMAIAQNGGATKLFRNAGGRKGLRVRLQGPPGNPSGVGSQLRVGQETPLGPVHEIHAGSGYWSQNSAVCVLSPVGSAAKVWVRWPGGATTLTEVPPGAQEITIAWNPPGR